MLDTVVYTYGDDSWGDLLTGYNGATISYDEIGNPLSDGTWTYTWERGRQLASMSDGTTTWTYTYDADGMRTSRTNGIHTPEVIVLAISSIIAVTAFVVAAIGAGWMTIN